MKNRKKYNEMVEKINEMEGYRTITMSSKSCISNKIFHEDKVIAEYFFNFYEDKDNITYSSPILNCGKFIILDENLETPDFENIQKFLEKGKEYKNNMKTKDWLLF